MDKWLEILSTMARNPLRTFLTSMGVFWGICMLVLMVGGGNGLQNGLHAMFQGFDMNCVFVWPQKSTMPYKGFRPGQMFNFKNGDIAALKEQVPELKYVCARGQLGGYGEENSVGRNKKMGNYTVTGDYPDYIHIQKLLITEGRFINDFDITQRRKVCIIGQTLAEELYEPGEVVMGSYIKVQGIYFQVVGVFNTQRQGQDAIQERRSVFVPFSTFQRVFNWGEKLGYFALSVREGFNPQEVEMKVKKILLARHNINPNDLRAIGSFNAASESAKFSNLFLGINFVIMVLGTGTLIAGGIGVMNIMLISVAERTKEIGIRKAMGATPGNIIGMIVSESILLTLLSGMIGLSIGVIIISLTDYYIGVPTQGADGEPSLFRRPEIESGTAIFSVIVLVIIGTLAGWYPARRAARVDPITALRTE
ncbi:ABC transporter permease [soil metagenome]